MRFFIRVVRFRFVGADSSQSEFFEVIVVPTKVWYSAYNRSRPARAVGKKIAVYKHKDLSLFLESYGTKVSNLFQCEYVLKITVLGTIIMSPLS